MLANLMTNGYQARMGREEVSFLVMGQVSVKAGRLRALCMKTI
jgi:hypothetical protein